MSTQSPKASPRRGPGAVWSRLLLVGIALTAILPFAAAWYAARHPETIERTSNYGTLVIPVLPLEWKQLAEGLHDRALETELRGRWILLQVAEGPCEAPCLESLHKTHQGWLMLNKEMGRVRRLLLTNSAKSEASSSLKEDDALITGAVQDALLAQLHAVTGTTNLEGIIFLVDPQRNLALWYPAGFDPYRLVKDLKHLLRASQIG